MTEQQDLVPLEDEDTVSCGCPCSLFLLGILLGLFLTWAF
jgi:hypothetical protein